MTYLDWLPDYGEDYAQEARDAEFDEFVLANGEDIAISFYQRQISNFWKKMYEDEGYREQLEDAYAEHKMWARPEFEQVL